MTSTPLPETAVFIATSLDGFIARPDGRLDWLPEPDEAEDYGYAAFMASVDVLVMGRTTFDVVRSFGSWPYGGTRVVVLTRRPLPDDLPPTASGSSLEPEPLLRQLGADGIQRVYVDGGRTIQRFLRAGLIGELIVTRVPVLLGEGIPLFGTLPHDVPLTHVETKSFANGLVQSRYHVGPDAGVT